MIFENFSLRALLLSKYMLVDLAVELLVKTSKDLVISYLVVSTNVYQIQLGSKHCQKAPPPSAEN